MKKRFADPYDKYSKREKIKKSSNRSKKSDEDGYLEKNFFLEGDTWQETLDSGGFRARVVEVHKRYAFVSRESKDGVVDTSDVWIATVARRFLQSQRKQRNFVCVGDRVLCQPAEKSTLVEKPADLPVCTIEACNPRTSVIARKDPLTNEREHVLAANMDQLVIVASYIHPTVKWGLIDRYLTLAEEQRLPAVIVLNKKDLLLEGKEPFQKDCQTYQELYQKIGYQVLSVQANDPTKTDVEQIKSVFRGRISLLSGHSGVGKSSLVNLLRPEIVRDVETEEILTKGRHTTTYASFIKLKTGGYVIDTPGIRSFLLEPRTAVELTYSFVELRPYLNQCKYRECQHRGEPECAVVAAVKEGKISEWRYKSYLAILTGASGREGRLRDLPLDDE